MNCKALGLGLAAALMMTAGASACEFHESVVENKTPVDYSRLQAMEVAQMSVDLWLVKYLDEWRKA